MPLFLYKAVNREGETVEGQREAGDQMSLIASLQAEGLMPIKVTAASKSPLGWLKQGSARSRLSQKDIGMFTRELLTLLQAGLPLDRALATLMELTAEQPEFSKLIQEVLESVKGGSQLSDALESHQGVFSRFYLNLIRAGEASGALEQVLDRLADYLERSRELRETVTSALIYPAILITLAIGSLLLLLTFVVPQFTEMFESAGKELPVPTQIVVGTAEFLRSYWWALGIVGFAVFIFMRAQLAEPSTRAVWDKRFLGIPMIGDMIRKVEAANFSRTLGTLMGNGVPLLTAISIVKETLSNRVVAENMDVAMESLKQGGGLSTPLIESGLFPPVATQMIRIGEESGRLAEMLDRVALTLDREVRLTVQRLLALLEPVLIVGLGIVIGGIIVSILMAILSVNDLAF